MVKLVHRSALVACLAVAALVGACGDDDDGNNNTTADAGPPDAGGRTFGFALTKGAEKPTECAMAGANAGGTASVTVNAANTEIAVMASFSGLGSAVMLAHIHYGNDTQAGPVAINLFPSGTSPTNNINRTFTSADYTPNATAGGVTTPATFAEFVTGLKSGNAYINVHSANCPGGEIRGQIR